MNGSHPVIVLTPVRNEAWILRRFLDVTSRCADRIVVADQDSSDGSRTICAEYPAVTLIENDSRTFNEAERQTLLIETARQLVRGPKVLLALDADELLAADAVDSPGWQSMLAARPGTVIEMELCDLFQSVERCIRYDALTPLGYVDDGADHLSRKIHSTRIPTPQSAPRLRLPDVTVMHYALTRLDAYDSRKRFYSVVENVLGTSHVLQRRRGYAAKFDFASPRNLEESGGRIERTPLTWLKGWEDKGIDLRTIPTATFYWQDFEVLRYFREYGGTRFWLDDIWNFDWNACCAAAPDQIPDSSRVRPPPAVVKFLMRLADLIYGIYLRARRSARSSKTFLDGVNDPANVRLS